ncbi:MAG: PhzF family phenazine biosynthesis protein [Bacillota bacterium]|nr:PhzF family phenazine biosynthesis protein [Bacillota bacterium]
MRFQIVDAFTDSLFGGNPAGVVIIPDGQDYPDDETMRKTAAELRYSETAFIKKLGEGRFQARYFTPAAEVDLCGHATIGSSYALTVEGLADKGSTITYETLAGNIDITISDDGILMGMGDPASYGTLESGTVVDLYHILGLEAHGQDVCGQNPEVKLAPEKVSTGLIDIMTPVKDEKELEAIDPDFKAMSELSEKQEVVGVHAFTINSEDGLIHARNFAPLYDIDEEAATGTSNGALAFYLYQHGLIEPDKVYTVVQGEKMGRPSKISFQVIADGADVKVKVGGSAVTLAEGSIEI